MSLSPRHMKLLLDYQQEKNDKDHNGVAYFTDTTDYRVTFEKGKAVQYFHYEFLERPRRKELKNQLEPNKPVNLAINRNDTSLYAVGAVRDKYHHSSLSSGEPNLFAETGHLFFALTHIQRHMKLLKTCLV